MDLSFETVTYHFDDGYYHISYDPSEKTLIIKEHTSDSKIFFFITLSENATLEMATDILRWILENDPDLYFDEDDRKALLADPEVDSDYNPLWTEAFVALQLRKMPGYSGVYKVKLLYQERMSELDISVSTPNLDMISRSIGSQLY